MTSHGINYDLKKLLRLDPIFSMEKTSFLLENVAISMHSFTKEEDDDALDDPSWIPLQNMCNDLNLEDFLSKAKFIMERIILLNTNIKL